MAVRHAFVSGKAASADTTQVDGPRWDADHLSPPYSITMVAQVGSLAWTNMPSALTEWYSTPNRYRVKADLTNARQARVTVAVNVAAAANAECRVQYATDGDGQGTWAYLDGVDGPKVNVGSIEGKASAWVNLASGAKADVWLRLVGINGDGAADPSFGTVTVQLR